MIEYEDLKLSNLPFMQAFKESAVEVIDSGWYILGQAVKDFELAFAQSLNVEYCIGVASGLDALKLSLNALQLPKGSEVIVASNSYIATVFSILQAGLTPVLVEPSLDDYNLDVSKIEAAITPKTKAILPVHLYGYPCEMAALMALADKHHLKVVEDCAQAHGAKYQGQSVGTFGQVNAWSFYPTKNLGALGDGGAISTNDESLAQKVAMLRNYGSKVKYTNEMVGFNSRLDEMQATFLSVKLKALPQIVSHKRALAQLYHDGLGEQFIKPNYQRDESVYHIYPIRTPHRDSLKAYLLSKGVKTEIHYPIAPYEQAPVRELLKGHYPISDTIHQQILSLPISYGHTQEEILKVIDIMNGFKP